MISGCIFLSACYASVRRASSASGRNLIPKTRPAPSAAFQLGPEYSEANSMNAEFRVVPVGYTQPYFINSWTISGVESCVTVRHNNERYAFDMGQATKASLNCDKVFITHGHVDHCGGLPKHVSQRDMRKMSPATYYCPTEIEQPLKDICRTFASMSDHQSKDISDPKIIGVDLGRSVSLGGKKTMEPFRTYHRVPSQGFLIRTPVRVLLSQFTDLSGPEIGEYISQGYELHETTMVPEIAYTGDTTFETFQDERNADILTSRILITEVTYIDDRQSPAKAKERGHMHLKDVAINAELFRDVGALVLVHLSDRYTGPQTAHWVRKTLPAWLLAKTWVPTLMKDLE